MNADGAGRSVALALAGTSLGHGVVQSDVTVLDVAVTSIRGDLGIRVVVAVSASSMALALLAMLVADRNTAYAAIVVELMVPAARSVSSYRP